ncbi:MAG: hypothetical protein Q3966_05355 [Neisseria sp.]|nr:hypothetical protein [Neisseria sp.]
MTHKILSNLIFYILYIIIGLHIWRPAYAFATLAAFLPFTLWDIKNEQASISRERRLGYPRAGETLEDVAILLKHDRRAAERCYRRITGATAKEAARAVSAMSKHRAVG